jgi:hypothetical protein
VGSAAWQTFAAMRAAAEEAGRRSPTTRQANSHVPAGDGDRRIFDVHTDPSGGSTQNEPAQVFDIVGWKDSVIFYLGMKDRCGALGAIASTPSSGRMIHLSLLGE